MEVSVQLHKVLHPKGSSSWYSLKYKAKWVPELVWMFGEDKILTHAGYQTSSSPQPTYYTE
jgi:hypothetical protein